MVVADDDSDALELVVTDLQLSGHDVVGAVDNGDSAFELVAELAPDVVVLDHRMPPGTFGMDIAAKVRAEFPDVLVIVYSNYQDVGLRRRARALGVTFLAKGNIRHLRRLVDGG